MMPLLEILFWSFVVFYVYRFVSKVILPVARATRHVRQQFRNMQDPNMQDPMGGGQAGRNSGGTGQTSGQAGQRPSGKAPAGDYIDFEEIK